MGIKDDLYIDKFSLDTACLQQAMLYSKYSMELAEVAFTRDTMKEQLEILKAEVDGEIRSSPEEYGLPSKPTETAIKNMVTCDSRVVDFTSLFLAKSKEYNILMGVRIALEHKKSALELLVKLHVSGYYAETNVSTVDKKEVEEVEMVEKLNSNPRLQKRRVKNG
jgi:hypothetical protein